MRSLVLRLLVVVVLPSLASGCFLFRVKPPVYDPVTYASGVVVQDLVVPEEGPGLLEGDEVTLDYRLMLADGTQVDSTHDNGNPVTFELGSGQVPAGLEEGLVGMRLYHRRRITVPPALGYGAAGLPPRIPPDAVLVFEVEVMRVERAARPLEEEEPEP